MKMRESDSIERRFELKYCSAEKLYGFLRNHLGDLVNMFPDVYKTIEVVEGQTFCAGSVVHFQYHLGDEVVSEKWLIKVVDDATKCIIFEAVEGDMLNYYKMLRAKMEAFNGRSNKIGESFGKWTVEFEKAYENVPKPKTHMDLFVEMSKAIDAYYLSNN
ncbi:hypothetical protein IC582_003727 [Cucumis melo]|uniref:Kirola-like n=1 Tax=Cucumis melo TaxID=3656 RepID=A0A1S3B8U5_CUCME|nr:kirola-like [Cucumis melo]